MWKEELDIIVKDAGIHEIGYQLQNNEVVGFMIRCVRYKGKYCIEAESRTYSDRSYWIERTFTISKIHSIDGVPYDQSISHLNYIRKCEEERKNKEQKNKQTSSRNPDLEAKGGCIGFFGTAGLVLGGALFGGLGAIIGLAAGVVFAIWYYDNGLEG
jgi:hypothetical protein